MSILFFKVLIAHLIGDFSLQPYYWVKSKDLNKLKSPYLYLHIIVHLFCLLFILEFKHIFFNFIIFIVLAHFIIDSAKVVLDNGRWSKYLFFLDQIFHLISLFIGVYLFKSNLSILYLLHLKI